MIPEQQKVQVGRVRPAELAAVGRLVTAAYAEFERYLTAENWTRMMTNIGRVIEPGAPGQLLVARLGGQVVGTVTYLAPGPKDYRRVPEDWAVIRVLAVDPVLRGRGIARLLTDACLDRARADHAPVVGLHTALMMTAARALYESLGFVHHEDFTHLGVPFCIYMLRL